MDNDWKRKASRAAAGEMVTEAEALLRNAEEIFTSNGFDDDARSITDALLRLDRIQ